MAAVVKAPAARSAAPGRSRGGRPRPRRSSVSPSCGARETKRRDQDTPMTLGFGKAHTQASSNRALAEGRVSASDWCMYVQSDGGRTCSTGMQCAPLGGHTLPRKTSGENMASRSKISERFTSVYSHLHDVRMDDVGAEVPMDPTAPDDPESSWMLAASKSGAPRFGGQQWQRIWPIHSGLQRRCHLGQMRLLFGGGDGQAPSR